MNACQEATEACAEKAKANPEKMKAVSEEMEVMVEVFEERLDKMDTMDLEANEAKSDATVEHQETAKEEAVVATIGALED
jgi:hypothetical protein